VKDALEALALQDRGGQSAALAAAADRGDLPVSRQLSLAIGKLAVGEMDRAGDVRLRELVLVPDVEDD